MASNSVIAAIKRIVESISNQPPLLKEVGVKIFPLVLSTLRPDVVDILDEGINIANTVIYGTRSVPEQYIALLPHII